MMTGSRISELIVKKYVLKRNDDFFALHCIVKYKSGRIVTKTYYNSKDIPYTIQDYMNFDNVKDMKEMEQPNSILRVTLTVYREE